MKDNRSGDCHAKKKDLLVMAIIVIAAIVLGAICGKLLLDNVI